MSLLEEFFDAFEMLGKNEGKYGYQVYRMFNGSDYPKFNIYQGEDDSSYVVDVSKGLHSLDDIEIEADESVLYITFKKLEKKEKVLHKEIPTSFSKKAVKFSYPILNVEAKDMGGYLKLNVDLETPKPRKIKVNIKD